MSAEPQYVLKLTWGQITWGLATLGMLAGLLVGGAAGVTRLSTQMEDFKNELGVIRADMSRLANVRGYSKSEVDEMREEADAEHARLDKRLGWLEHLERARGR